MSANPFPSPNPLHNGPAASMTQGQAGSPGLTPVDPLRVLRQYAWLLVATAILGLFVGAGSWYALRKYAPVYTTEAQLAISGGIADPFAPPSSPDAMSNMQMEMVSAFIRNQTIRIRSHDILNQALQRQEIQKTAWFRAFYRPDVVNADGLSDVEYNSIRAARIAAARDDLQLRSLEASQLRGSTYMSIALSARAPKEPKDLQVVLDIIIQIYIRQLGQDQDANAIGLRQTFNEERKIAQEDIRTIQEGLRQFTIENDLPNLQAQGHEAQIAYNLVADQETRLRMAAQSSHDSYKALLAAQTDGAIAVTKDMIQQAEASSPVASRDERLRVLRETRDVLLQRFLPNHREVKQVDDQISATQVERQKEFERLLREIQQIRIEESRQNAESLALQHAGILPKLEEARTKMRDLNIKLQEYTRRADEARAAMEKRDKSDQLLTEVSIMSKRSDAVRVRAQQNPVEPIVTFPPKAIITIPGITILLLGLVTGLVFLREMLDQRVKAPGDLRFLTRLDMLGMLPDASEDPSGPAQIDNVVLKDPTGLMAEAFRQIRTAVLARMDRRGYKTLMVVGAQPLSGASTLVCNLAASLAHNSRKVLVIDANLRRPMQHDLFAIPAQPGLVEVLRGGTTFDAALVRKDAAGVDVLAAGNTKDAPPEILEGPAFRGLLGQLESQYDLILIDAPPALLASDAQMLAKHADAVCLVARAMNDKRGMVARMLRTLEGHRADVLGYVLNATRSSAGGYFRQSYEDFYRYRQAATTRPGVRRRGTVPLATANANERNNGG